jgi:hypothetical protein
MPRRTRYGRCCAILTVTISGTRQLGKARSSVGKVPTRSGVRHFFLRNGAELREQLLTLSDLEQSFSYCLLDTPVPLFNYVAHVRLAPVTDGNRTFWDWRCSFSTRKGEEAEMARMVGEDIYDAGFAAIRNRLAASAGLEGRA